MLSAFSLWIGFLAWGSHAVVPWSLQRGEEASRKAWALLAAPLLLTAVIASLLSVRANPDGAIEQGMFEAQGSSLLLTITILSVAALVVVDLVTAIAVHRFEESSWIAVGSVGILSLFLICLAGERLRIGIGPGDLGPAWLATACVRVAISASAGEILSRGRPEFAPWAGLALTSYAFFLPLEVREIFFAQGLFWTALAGSGLFVSSRYLPPRWQRIALLAATLLAALLLDRVAEISDYLGRLSTTTVPAVLQR